MQVIVPAIGSGSGAGLSDWRGWLGFGLSLASMATTVVYFVSLQASRRLGFTSLQLQVGGGMWGCCAVHVGPCRAMLRSLALAPYAALHEPPTRVLTSLSTPLQYLYLLLSITVLLPITLCVDGADWSANFRGWTAGDWAVLCVLSCCIVISANLCIQYRCGAVPPESLCV